MPILLRELKKFYKTGKRDLPWRRTRDPYKILVSEVMLQQTQVERVIPFYRTWVKKFPTARSLAKAKLPEVLNMWQGLGYNRRGKYLHEAAKMLCVAETKPRGHRHFPADKMPLSRADALDLVPARFVAAPQLSTEFLESLPGVGHYTARAVATFAYNRPEVFIETNVRTVFFHHLKKYQGESLIKERDKELLPLVKDALKKSHMEPREFYWALMDYGAHLKKQGVRLNSRSKHYTKQSRFEGSRRQARAARLRKLLASGASEAELEKALR